MSDVGARRIGVVVAARTQSTRLPGKALLELGGQPMIGFLLQRIGPIRLPTAIVLATTNSPPDDELAGFVSSLGFAVFRGAVDDVVERYVAASRQFGFDYIVRVTGDCPFVDAESLDYFIDSAFADGPFDLASTKGAFPTGIDYELFASSCLEELHRGVLDSAQREHLTKVFYDRQDEFVVRRIEPRPDWRDRQHTYTVDTPEDYARARRIVSALGRADFSIADLVTAAHVD